MDLDGARPRNDSFGRCSAASIRGGTSCGPNVPSTKSRSLRSSAATRELSSRAGRPPVQLVPVHIAASAIAQHKVVVRLAGGVQVHAGVEQPADVLEEQSCRTCPANRRLQSSTPRRFSKNFSFIVIFGAIHGTRSKTACVLRSCSFDGFARVTSRPTRSMQRPLKPSPDDVYSDGSANVKCRIFRRLIEKRLEWRPAGRTAKALISDTSNLIVIKVAGRDDGRLGPALFRSTARVA